MDGSAVEKIIQQARENLTVEIEGKTYSFHSLHPVYHDPRPDPATVRTLTGIIEFIQLNVDGYDLSKCFLLVENEAGVSLMTGAFGPSNSRQIIAKAEYQPREGEVEGYHPLEEFQISLRASFDFTPDIDLLLDFLGKVRIEEGSDIEDNGVSQKVTVRRGLSGAIVDNVKQAAPAIVTLKPYSTFPEIEQPDREYAFRMRRAVNGGVECGLFSAGGDYWRVHTAYMIRNYLTDKQDLVQVIA